MKIGCRTWEEIIEEARKELDCLKKQEKLFGDVYPDFDHEFVPGIMPRLVIYCLEDLTAARKLMREVLGAWHDKLANKFYSVGRAITIWRNPGSAYEIWLETPVGKDPLLSDGCRWKPHTETRYTYVCESA